MISAARDKAGPPTTPRVLLGEHGNLELSAGPETAGKPPSPAMSQTRGGAFVVVGARESRAHGEGRQSMSRAAKPLGKAMYVGN